MAEMTGRFMTAKQRAVDSSEIKLRTWDELYATCERLVKAFGKDRLVIDLAADDFERLRANIAEVYGPVRLGNEIQRVRSVGGVGCLVFLSLILAFIVPPFHDGLHAILNIFKKRTEGFSVP